MYARKTADYRRLEAVIAYCKEDSCNRANLLEYFGGRSPEGRACGNCSACSGGAVSAAVRRGREKTATVKPAAAAGADDEIFWASNKKSFSLGELKKREVPRVVGLQVLGIISEAGGALSASAMANLLIGSRGCDAVKSDPRLSELKCFGVLRGRKYADVLEDVLAMYAKGYLGAASSKGRKLALTSQGSAVLAKTHPESQA
jgi:hypothetical protein